MSAPDSGGHRSGGRPPALAGATIRIVRRACSLGRDHARADRVVGRASGREDAAVRRLLQPAQDRGALAGLAVTLGYFREREAPLGIEVGVLLPYAQRAPRQLPEPAPFEALAQL